MDLFPDTRWTILAEATLNGDAASQESLSSICEKYTGPVDKMVKLKGVPDDRVEDVRQDFFIHMMKGSFFKKASKRQGKFRTFLLKALQDFLIDDFRKLSAEKRGGGKQHDEIDENSAVSSDDTLEFDLVWAETLYDNALSTVAGEVNEKRGEKAWSVLQRFLSSDGSIQNYQELATVLKIGIGGAKAEVSRLRQKFRNQLRAEVSKTVDAPHEIDEELRYLKEAMMHVWGGKRA